MFAMLPILMIVVVHDLARILLSIDVERQPGNDVVGFKILGQMLIADLKPR